MEIGSVDAALVEVLEAALAGLGKQDSILRVQVLARLSRELYWSDTPDRARVNVTKQIKVAIGRIEERAPALAADLKRSVRTGRVCSYTPDPRAPIDWEL